MSDIKPNVFPNNQPQKNNNLTDAEKLAAYEEEKIMVTNEIYSSQVQSDTPYEHMTAVEQMRLRTEAQLRQKQEVGVVKEPYLSERASTANYQDRQKEDGYNEQMRLRDEQLKKNSEQTQNYQRLSEEAMSRNKEYYEQKPMQQQQQQQTYQPQPSSPAMATNPAQVLNQKPAIDPYILELSQPNYNAPFDVIPLPSKGKLYKSKKANVRLSYMTTSDENILTSPNLLKSGEFLEILINRKLLEPELRYRDLLPGDRNAIMLWLRATAYGEMYPVTILDEFDEPFDTEINLSELKSIELEVDANEEGLLEFTLPISKGLVKFKLLTCGDIEDIEALVKRDEEKNIPLNNTNTYKLEKMFVEVNGERNRTMITDFINYMRIADSKAFNEYVNTLDSGIDLNIEVGTPGGGSVKTFLPLNVNFFWPNIGV
jgi:hypothetical protein